MNRRDFIQLFGATATGLLVPELWTPSRTFFLPPAGGWKPQYDYTAYVLDYLIIKEEIEDNFYELVYYV